MSRISLNVILKIGKEPGLDDTFTFTQSPLLVTFMWPQTFIRCHVVVPSSHGDKLGNSTPRAECYCPKFRAEPAPTALCIHSTSKEKLEKKTLTVHGLGTLPEQWHSLSKGKVRKQLCRRPDEMPGTFLCFFHSSC